MTRTRVRAIAGAVVFTSGALGILAACSHAAGAPGCPTLSTECPANTPSWQNEVQPLIATYCFQCHGEGGIEQSQFDYTTYQGVYKNRAEMLTQVYQCQMPPSDASPPAVMPDPEQRQTLISWLVCGAPGDN